MEYLPSRSLAAILTEYETLPVPEVARIGEQVASALIAAHPGPPRTDGGVRGWPRWSSACTSPSSTSAAGSRCGRCRSTPPPRPASATPTCAPTTTPADALRHLPIGPAEVCAQRLGAFAAAGVERILLWPLADEVRQLELVRDRVIPLVSPA